MVNSVKARWLWWLRATRPRTLPLSVLPTAIGIAWAWRDGAFNCATACGTLLCAVLLQVLANYVNELGDYERGADTPDRIGPPRAVALGAISPAAMRKASLVLSAIILALGVWLVRQAGWWLLAVGLAALALAWLYTTGTRPLAYVGFGEAAALVFFGIVPAAGAYAIEHSRLATEPILSGIAFGCFAAAVLGINNLRDVDRDRACGKRTLAVRLGTTRATTLVQFLLGVPYAVAIVLSSATAEAAATVATLPLVWRIGRELQSADGAQYTVLLERTVRAASLYGVLLGAAIVGATVR
ncbi:MAG: 1,4-dihydroxy-2-naphthoate octaprenyltransferase [Candidatus Kapaibacterium sp.]|nr:MAG: 1,4-dihydroxy-2-naphthoate octaprenyltransferase [Candidatus Kapabacteria bacterium]